MTNKYENVGYNQLKEIIKEIMESQDYPQWDFLNGVLSCSELLGDYKLWYWMGDLRIVPKKDYYEGKKVSGDFSILEDWNTEKDGTMTLIPKKNLEQEGKIPSSYSTELKGGKKNEL